MLRATIAAILCLLTASANAEEWTSKVARVIDGDTFQLSRPLVRIRLCGVDTPEKGQRGYREATQYTETLVAGKTVQCRTVGEGTPCDGRSRKKSYDRFVAQCFVDGEDIAGELVEAGNACAWEKYSGKHYFKSGRCIK
ncbi:thermonuclease family protein [uncultured Roseibium sp.]|uniref:thermonuclease family protein n=1 Tax=uncultured Roseibium sp. TaxID=1936171 RepID=UPI00262F67B0|nr:thermonuclease family protein [uncultured Roseibium sp.]